MDFTTLTLTELFSCQAETNARHESFVRSRNECAPGSFDWDLRNAAVTGTMMDIADIAREITRRITVMQGDAQAAPGDELQTRVPMACTDCGTPVMQYGPGQWMHKTAAAARACPRSGGPVRARAGA
jgi:hypothetical protein